MTHKISLFLAAGAALLLTSVTPSHAQHSGRHGGTGFRQGGNFGQHRGGYYGGHSGRHRYFYRGSYFYYDPFFFGGFGYPAYYYGGFGPSFGVGYSDYGDGYYGERVYQGRIASGVITSRREGKVDVEDERGESSGRYSPKAMARAVQSELKERGYYKGTVDGQFGDGTASALREFQRDKGLKVTGRLDERTLKALGFDER